MYNVYVHTPHEIWLCKKYWNVKYLAWSRNWSLGKWIDNLSARCGTKGWCSRKQLFNRRPQHLKVNRLRWSCQVNLCHTITTIRLPIVSHCVPHKRLTGKGIHRYNWWIWSPGSRYRLLYVNTCFPTRLKLNCKPCWWSQGIGNFKMYSFCIQTL